MQVDLRHDTILLYGHWPAFVHEAFSKESFKENGKDWL